MILNIIVGSLIPLVPGIYLFKKDRLMFLLIAPVGSVLAWSVNQLGNAYGFWEIRPLQLAEKSLSAMPLNLGLYPVISALMIFAHRTYIRNAIVVPLFACLLTLLEYIGVLANYVLYYRGWNIYWTFVSYLLPLTLVFAYCRWLEHAGILQSPSEGEH